MKKYAILLDDTFCTGCNSCAYRCIQEFRYHDQASKGLFRTFVQINDDGLYQKRCMHCLEPDCVENCPVKALTKSEYGPVLYDAQKCIGCQTCVRVCKFHVPLFDADTKKIVKCSMCAHRIADDKKPACVEICPTGALQFGEYEAMKKLAAKLAKEKKLKLYGYEENGGTHLFVLAKEDPTTFGYPKVAKKALKGKALLDGELGVPALAALAVVGFKKYSERRTRLETETKKEKK
ncbi:MAG: 4Fe-4S binding protein [Smithellaceae bacterium]|nr:4Fe-4S binding protein [Syntrophaceae bacterium]MDD4241961.1 4Fe-4S binding protein [Smithellaceae bacterium]NLX53256.1 4Fe-4S binding protein [Deltaproteobacteria bacterium]